METESEIESSDGIELVNIPVEEEEEEVKKEKKRPSKKESEGWRLFSAYRIWKK